jgi:ribosome maturation factor RimP
MHVPAGAEGFAETFERVARAIPDDPDFAAVEVVTTALRPGRTAQLTVMVDREGGVDIATCERVAARINAALDAFPDTLYTLEVSSAGVERPLIARADYDRFAGRPAKVVTNVAIGNAKTHRGVLGGLRGDDVVLLTGNAVDVELALPFAAIKAANLEYDIRADLQRAKKAKKG